jgi:hypothetical protein
MWISEARNDGADSWNWHNIKHDAQRSPRLRQEQNGGWVAQRHGSFIERGLKRNSNENGREKEAPLAGLEPATLGLTVRCSTTKLQRRVDRGVAN